jgi:hypothetical protein
MLSRIGLALNLIGNAEYDHHKKKNKTKLPMTQYEILTDHINQAKTRTNGIQNNKIARVKLQ